MFTVTAKLRILPDEKQAELLVDTRRAYTAACNFVSKYAYKEKCLKRKPLNKALYQDIREKFGLGAQMAQSVISTVIARYESAKSNGHAWSRVEFKHPDCDLVWNRDYSLKNGVFSVGTLEGRKKLKFHTEGMEHFFNNGWKFGTAKLVNKHGKWFLHVPMSKEIERLEDKDIANVAGIDLGINFLATIYDGSGKTVFHNGRHIKQKRGKYKKTRQQLQKKQTPSARKRLKTTGQRENRWIQDVNHCISKALVGSQPKQTLFVIEDLTGIRNTTERVRLKDRYVSTSWAFYDLRMKLEYKAWQNGSKVMAVCPRHTSQTCPICGHRDRKNRDKKKHLFRCRECGYTSNDDRVAAMNLYNKGIGHLAA